jgi:glyoxylase-like metal-dependent hydrolase (beta-lactamase superfamily II)
MTPTADDAHGASHAQHSHDPADFVTGAPVTGSLDDVRWIHGVPARRRQLHVTGAQSAPEPRIQVHHHDTHTVILRQSKAVDHEAPFLFLLFGNDRALLLDSGATKDPELFPLRATVDGLIADWLAAHPFVAERERAGGEPYGLVVAHTHAHGDHIAGDGQFADRPATTVVGHGVDAVRAFFGFGDGWPAATVPFDLGGRVLEVLGSPGHHESAITVHDPWTGFLFTGDTVLPGRLYVADLAAFTASLDRMVDFAASRTVTQVLGCHVEMSRRAGRDYPIGAQYQPKERALPLAPGRLTAIRDAAAAVAGRPGVYRHEDFVLYNEPRRRDTRRLLLRGRTHQAAGRAVARLAAAARRGRPS